MNFDVYSSRYHQEVEQAIGLPGVSHDYCTEVKAAALLAACRRHCGRPEHLEVLDLGCGVGLTDAYLAPAVGSLWGIDLSTRSIAVAARRNRGVHYRAYDGDRLPFPDGRFDVVFTINVMHHVKPSDWPRFVDEMRRVTRPGGIDVVFEHNPLNPITRAIVNRCAFDADAVLLSRRCTTKLFVKAGSDVIDGRYILLSPFRSRVLQFMERGLGWVPLGAQYYLVTRPGRRMAPAARRAA